MDEAELTTRLIRAENELRSLKTAHRSGSNSLSIISRTVNIGADPGGRFRMHVKIADSAPPNPLIQMFADWAQSYSSSARWAQVNIDSNNPDTARDFYRIIISNYLDEPFNIYIRSTSEIESVSVEAY